MSRKPERCEGYKILKSLIRTFFIEISLEVIFEKVFVNFYKSTISTFGSVYVGELRSGMKFRKAIWKSKFHPDILIVYDDVTIIDLKYENLEDMHYFKFSYYEDNIQDYQDDDSSINSMEFYI